MAHKRFLLSFSYLNAWSYAATDPAVLNKGR